MNLLEDLPDDLIGYLIETLCKVSKVSLKVFAHVNKFCYHKTAQFAIEHEICRSLECHEIAAEGLLEVLKWAQSEGSEWDLRVCSNAARNGHMEILKWARSQGCHWDFKVCSNAARNGHIEIL